MFRDAVVAAFVEEVEILIGEQRWAVRSWRGWAVLAFSEFLVYRKSCRQAESAMLDFLFQPCLPCV